MRKFLAAIAGSPTVIEPMSPEAAALAKLSAPPVKEDPGELSVIAYAYHHPDTIAVLHDRAAVFRGIEELRGRTLRRCLSPSAASLNRLADMRGS